jgi:hypothetical protein
MRRDEPAGSGSRYSSYSTRRSIHLRPVGFGLHPRSRCAWCGSQASSSTLKVKKLVWTASPTAICEDAAACARRQYWRTET